MSEKKTLSKKSSPDNSAPKGYEPLPGVTTDRRKQKYFQDFDEDD